MTSKNRSTLSDIKVGESALEDIMSRAYDKFDIQLSSIQLLYSKHSKYSYKCILCRFLFTFGAVYAEIIINLIPKQTQFTCVGISFCIN